jgi:glycosyltransferase involved in cell wall biosynthesis
VQYPWEGFARQRQRSLQHATHEWIFSLDADEEISGALRAEILAVLRDAAPRAGYRVPRKTRYLGRWIEHSGWYPDYQLRLFRKSQAELQARNVHEGFTVRGDTADLTGVLYHYSYDSLADHLEKINRYTSLEAPEKLRQLGGRRIRWHHLLFNPLSRFWRMYISRQGFRDGFQGFLLASMGALYTQMLYAKMWERQREERGVG